MSCMKYFSLLLLLLVPSLKFLIYRKTTSTTHSNVQGCAIIYLYVTQRANSFTPDLRRSGETYCFTSFPRAGTCVSVRSEVGNLGDNILPEAKEILLLDIMPSS